MLGRSSYINNIIISGEIKLAKITNTQPQIPVELLVPISEAKSKLEERIEKGAELKKQQAITTDELDALRKLYYKWNDFNCELLKRLFTTEKLADEYSRYGPMIMSLNEPSLGKKIQDLNKDIDDKIHRIDSIIERLELIPLNSSQKPMIAQEAKGKILSKKVFIVHGHDEVAKTNLEIFLQEIGLEPIVLHRQADEGLTIIEKFEKHSDVSYAFILLTPDEVGYLSSEKTKPDNERNKENRARSNVIFEFGFFVGKLGRSKVCCLYTGDVSLPSDVSGMIYKKFDRSIEEVAYGIIKDLKASGFQIT